MQTLKLRQATMTFGTRCAATLAAFGTVLNYYYVFVADMSERSINAAALTMLTFILFALSYAVERSPNPQKWITVSGYTLAALGCTYAPVAAVYGGGLAVAAFIVIFLTTLLAYGMSIRFSNYVAVFSGISIICASEFGRPLVYPDEVQPHLAFASYVIIMSGIIYVINKMAALTTEQSRLLSRALEVGKIGLVSRSFNSDELIFDSRSREIMSTDERERMVPVLQQMDKKSYDRFMVGCGATEEFDSTVCWNDNKMLDIKRFVENQISVWLIRDITQYHQALQDAKEKSIIVEQIANATAIAMWRAEWDTHKIIEANDRFYNIVGCTEDEWNKNNTLQQFLSIHSQEDQKDIISKRKSMDITNLDDATYTDLRTIHGKDGKTRYVQSHVHIRTLADGHKVIDGAFVDVTDTENMSRKYLNSLTQLEMTVEAGNIGLFRHNLEDDTIEVNDNYRKMREIPKHIQPLTIQRATQHVTSDVDEKTSYDQLMHIARMDTSPTIFNAVYTSPITGEVTYQRVVAKPVFDHHGKLIAMTGAVFDITEETEALKTSKQTLTRLQEVTEAGRIGLFSHNVATDALEINDVLRDILDLPKDEFPDVHLSDFFSRVPEEYKEMVTNDIHETNKNGKPRTLSWEICDRYGKNRTYIELKVTPKLKGGQLISVSGAVFDVSEQKNLNIELQKTQYRVDILNQAGGIGIFDVNLSTNECHCTDEILKRAGMPLDYHTVDVLPFHEMVPEEDREAFEQHVVAMKELAVGEVYKFSHSQNSVMGRLQIDVTATKISVNGEEHVIGTATDITEQYNIRREIEQSNQFVNQLIDAAQIGIFRSRQDTREFTYVNDYYRKIMDLPKEEFPVVHAEEHFSRFNEEDRLRVITRRDSNQESFGQPYIETRKVEAADGSDRYVRASIVVNPPQNGQPYNTVSGAIIDVTDQMIAAARISEQLMQMDMLADFGNVAVFEVDLNTMRAKGNKTLFTREGIDPSSAKDISTLRLWKDVTPETAELIDETLENMKAYGEGYQVNIEYETSRPNDTTHKTYRLVGRKAYKNHRPVMLGVSIDTTDHTRLIGQLKMANQSKDAFLSQMSHEIRTPLNGIYGALQMLSSDSKMTAEERFYVDTALSSYRDVITIVNDILDSARIARGTLTFNNKPTFLMPVLEEVFNEFQNEALGKGITYKMNGGYNNPYDVRIMDEVRVKQIARNLLSNAMKNTTSGSIIFGVDIDDDNVILTITDTGIGIKPEDQERIFERFEQTGTEEEMGMGTGLGLSIVTYLAREMNGQVSVSSTYGEGSAFRVRIKLERSSPSQAKVLNSDEYMEPKNVEDIKVLLVDDVRTNLMILEAFVKKEVAHVDTVMSGEQALSKIKEMGYDHYDIVFMDIKMPGMGGLEAARRLQDNGFVAPIIASTANVMKSDIDTYLRTGFATVLGKPYERAEVAKIIRTYCY